jgi:Family of unknown function (DUF6194)
MDEGSITQYIIDTFEGIYSVIADGNTFFFYDPDRTFPFATLATNDAYDQASNLNRPSVFRLNIGISKQTYHSLFGAQTPLSDAGGGDSSYDFTTLDQVLPHPVYGRQYWVCVLNPSAATFQAMVRPLLAEAYDLAVSKRAKRAAHG